ncbi:MULTISPECIES: hypothetical protein [unclassified Afipia]|uniref:hypothetical protein n=1 Tax=unclassified Afipia TaxID=2642050 RepID=UPI000466935A|nr:MULTISPECIES: hypothetical protein [unclassified Afipia]
MNERSRRRAIRNFVASILISNLSKFEIYEVIDDLSYGSLGREIAEALREASGIIRDEPTARHLSSEKDDVFRFANVAYETVQRRKMPKKILIKMMIDVAPKLFQRSRPPNGTVRELLELFFEKASPSQAAQLLNLVNDGSQDPYLKGIVRRS